MSISKEFILAGEAVFTVELPADAKAPNGVTHYTYQVERSEATDRYPEAWFVKILTGPNNRRDYTYLGKLNDWTGAIYTTRASPYAVDAYPVRLLDRILRRLWAGQEDSFEQHGYHLHHEGFCGCCKRRLTTPESVKTGLGPKCRKILAGARINELVEASGDRDLTPEEHAEMAATR